MNENLCKQLLPIQTFASKEDLDLVWKASASVLRHEIQLVKHINLDSISLRNKSAFYPFEMSLQSTHDSVEMKKHRALEKH